MMRNCDVSTTSERSRAITAMAVEQNGAFLSLSIHDKGPVGPRGYSSGGLLSNGLMVVKSCCMGPLDGKACV